VSAAASDAVSGATAFSSVALSHAFSYAIGDEGQGSAASNLSWTDTITITSTDFEDGTPLTLRFNSDVVGFTYSDGVVVGASYPAPGGGQINEYAQANVDTGILPQLFSGEGTFEGAAIGNQADIVQSAPFQSSNTTFFPDGSFSEEIQASTFTLATPLLDTFVGDTITVSLQLGAATGAFGSNGAVIKPVADLSFSGAPFYLSVESIGSSESAAVTSSAQILGAPSGISFVSESGHDYSTPFTLPAFDVTGPPANFGITIPFSLLSTTAPEPGTLGLLSLPGALLIGGWSRRRCHGSCRKP